MCPSRLSLLLGAAAALAAPASAARVAGRGESHVAVSDAAAARAAPLGPDADRITALPGLSSSAAFEQYAGYLDVPGGKGNKSIFFWFVAATDVDPASAPVVAWTNGGPGCSGLLGFLSEQGPFRPDKDGNININDFAWTKRANMIFVEQPAGVGFSTVSDDADLTTGDEQASADFVNAVGVFFDKFSALRGNEFFVASESWGGHYAPWFSRAIIRAQAAGTLDSRINFGGMAVGNPFDELVENTYGRYGMLGGKQLVPAPIYNQWEASCKMVDLNSRPAACGDLEDQMDAITRGLNPYALDWPTCLSNDGRRAVGAQQRKMMAGIAAARRGKSDAAALTLGDYEPCEDDYVSAYLNRNDVQEAIHAKPSIKWSECSDAIRYDQDDYNRPSHVLYPEIIAAKKKVLIFSGDDDSICGGCGTQTWVWNINNNTDASASSWSAWNTDDGQVAGFVTRLEGYTYATVHGAGHEVPSYEPERALKLISNFLDGTW